MAKKYVDMILTVTVSFEDDGETDLASQAIDAEITSDAIRDASIEVLMGSMRETEMPA